MNNTENNPPNFNDKNEALEFMIQRSMDRKRKEKWAKEFAKEKNDTPDAKVISLRQRIIRISALAAVMIAGVLIFQIFPFGNPNLDTMATNLIEETNFQAQEVTRGKTMTDEEINQSLAKALQDKDYDKALNLYQQKTSEFKLEDNFFYAVALLKTDHPDHHKILELTANVMETDNEFFVEALWISALTHLKTNNLDKAQTELNTLLDYNYQTKNVNKLLSKISNEK